MELKYFEENLFNVPNIVVDISTISELDWLKTRKFGLCGSEIAGLVGANAHWDPMSLFVEKNTPAFVQKKERGLQFILDMGHAAEEPIRNAVANIYNATVINDTNMYQNSIYPFMRADCDAMLILPDGRRAILEIKTTSPENLHKWHKGRIGEDGKVPIEYMWQGRHYMATLNMDMVIFACSPTINELDKLVIVEMTRDPEIEDFLISREYDFWNNHVLTGIPPEVIGIPDNIMDRIRECIEHEQKAEEPEEVVHLDKETYYDIASKYLELSDQIAALESQVKLLEEARNAAKVPLIQAIGGYQQATIEIDSDNEVVITYKYQKSSSVDKPRLKTMLTTDQYNSVVIEKEHGSRPFRVKVKRKSKKASR